MKQILLTSILGAASATAFGQVSLGLSQAPVNNSMFTYYDANVPNPAFTFSKSGTGNTWDFTGVSAQSSDEDTSYVRRPSDVSGYMNFPGATHVLWEVGDKTKAFIKIDATGAYYVGVYGDVFDTGIDTVAMLYPSLANKVWDFPLQKGNFKGSSGVIEYQATGAQFGQTGIDSARYKGSFDNNREMLAEGTLIVPAGSFPALLEISRQNQIDSVFIKGSLTGGQWILAPGFPKERHDSTYYWYSNLSLREYAHVIYKNGVVDDVHYFKSVTVNSVSGMGAQAKEMFQVYPNPAGSKLVIRCEKPGVLNVKITTITGEQIMEVHSLTHVLDINNLNPGLYFFTITAEDGSSSAGKFIRQ